MELHMYCNNPTKGKTDGSEVSSGAGTNPVSVSLDSSKAEQQAVKCALRCDSGFKIDGDVSLSLTGTSSDKWKLAADADYADAKAALDSAAWQDSLAVSNVTDSNVIFWVKGMSTKDETPKNDTSVKIEVSGKVVAS